MTIAAANISKTGYLDQGTITLKKKPLEQRGLYPIHEPTYTGNIDQLLVLDKNWVIVSWNPYPDLYTYINTQSSGQLATYWATVYASYQLLDNDSVAWTDKANMDNLIEDYMVAGRKAIGEEDIGTTAYWAISSSDDTNYSTPQAPSNAHKVYYDYYHAVGPEGQFYTGLETHKALGMFGDGYRIYTYLQMPTALVDGDTYTITMDSGDTVTFLFDDDYTVSRAIKVNQAGYLNTAAEKYAYLGGYLHKHGPLDLSHATSFSVINADTGAVAFTGTPTLLEADPVYNVASANTSMYGEDVYELDFSAMTDTGTFFIKVPGVGRSWPFIHGDNAYSQAGYTIMRGLYHQRAGQAKLRPYTNWNRMNANTGPNYYESEYIYWPEHGVASDPSPWPAAFDVIGYSMDYTQSTAQVEGGYHDAADWDSRMYHLVAAFDLMYAYEANSSNFTDNQFNIPEGGDGLPDILSEVKHGLEVWRASQDGVTGGVSGYLETFVHPDINHQVAANILLDTTKNDYAYAQRTTWSSAHYAAAAAQFARLVAPFDASLASTWQTSAINAYNFAKNPANSLGATTINYATNGAFPESSNGDTSYGQHSSTSSATVFTFAGQNWTVNGFAGMEIINKTDGSRGTITSNTADTITCSGLSGGTNNTFENGDYCGVADKQSASWTQATADTDPYLVHAKCQLYLLTGTSTYITEADSVATILARFSQTPVEWPWKLQSHSVYVYQSVIDAYNAGATSLSSYASTWETWINGEADDYVANIADKPYTCSKERWNSGLLWDMQENLSWGQSVMTNHNRILECAYRNTGLAKYRTAMLLNMDFMLGCNPMGMSWTTGVGYVYPVCILHEPTRWTRNYDPVPGITPYGINGGNKWVSTRNNVWRSSFDSTGASIVSSLTQSGGTATLVSSIAHGLSTGDSVYIAGADQTEYNGTHTITVTNATTFTFAVDSGAVTPATGSITARVSWTDGTYQQSAPKWRIYSNNHADVGKTEFTVHETQSSMAMTAAIFFKNETIEDKDPRGLDELYGQWHFM